MKRPNVMQPSAYLGIPKLDDEINLDPTRCRRSPSSDRAHAAWVLGSFH